MSNLQLTMLLLNLNSFITYNSYILVTIHPELLVQCYYKFNQGESISQRQYPLQIIALKDRKLFFSIFKLTLLISKNDYT